jgi:uncharacterized protein YdhG (YjbR/CyaY superfamily)
MQSSAGSVAVYLKEVPDDRRPALTKLRGLIRKIAPDATESMEYGMPVYHLNGMLCAFASQKQNLALYVGSEFLEQFKPRLGKIKCGKGCIRFKKLEDLKLDVVEELLKANAAKARGRGEEACQACVQKEAPG